MNDLIWETIEINTEACKLSNIPNSLAPAMMEETKAQNQQRKEQFFNNVTIETKEVTKNGVTVKVAAIKMDGKCVFGVVNQSKGTFSKSTMVNASNTAVYMKQLG